MKRFKVSVGYDSKGRAKNRYFPTLTDANKFAGAYFNRTKIVVSIEEVTRKSRKKP